MAGTRVRIFPDESDRKRRAWRVRVIMPVFMVTYHANHAGKETEAVTREETLSQKFCR